MVDPSRVTLATAVAKAVETGRNMNDGPKQNDELA